MEYLLVVDGVQEDLVHANTASGAGHVHQLLITGHMQIDCGQ